MLLHLRSSLGRLRVVGYAEGVSFLLLLGIAMPLKYAAGMPGAVRVIGMAHGILFLLYLLAVILAAREHRWGVGRVAVFFVASVLPGGPFYADAKLVRDSRAGPSAADRSSSI